MNIFGVGSLEIMVLLVAALIIFGPGKLPEVAGQLGRAVRDFRRMTADLTGEFEKTMAEADDIKRSFNEGMSGMRSQVSSVSNSVKKDLAKSTTKASSATKASSVKSTTAKPGTTTSSSKPARSSATKSTSTTSTAPAKSALPKATKTNPTAGISLLEDAPRKARPATVDVFGDGGLERDPESNGLTIPAANLLSKSSTADSGNGSGVAATPPASDAIGRARQRRLAAGYGRAAG